MSQTTPLTDEQRVLRYLAHTNRAALTPRQEGRANKKRNQAEHRAELARIAAEEAAAK